MEDTIQPILATYQECLRSQAQLVELSKLTSTQADTRTSRTQKMIKILSEEAVEEILTQMAVGNVDTQDVYRRYRTGATNKNIRCADDDPSKGLGALRLMYDWHVAHLLGTVTTLEKKQRNSSPSKARAKTTESTDVSTVGTVIPVQMTRIVQPRIPTASEIEASWSDHWDLTLMFLDGTDLPREQSDAVHDAVRRSRNDRHNFRRWTRLKYGMRETPEEL
jgi:hypothetical protein